MLNHFRFLPVCCVGRSSAGVLPRAAHGPHFEFAHESEVETNSVGDSRSSSLQTFRAPFVIRHSSFDLSP